MRFRLSRRLAAAVVLSLLLHALISVFFRTRTDVPKPEFVVTSSAIRIEHRPKPQPHPKPQVERQVRTNPTQPKPRSEQQQTRTEIARITPRALVFQPKVSHSKRLTQSQAVLPQVDYQKTISELRKQNNPLLLPAQPQGTPAATKRYAFDFSGAFGNGPSSEGILTPETSWHDDGYDYYYVRYWVQYQDGSTETGLVPWPLRYRPQLDPFRLGIQHFPLPVPLGDYTLPPGTVLHPLVAYCFAHRAELTSCPIYHG